MRRKIRLNAFEGREGHLFIRVQQGYGVAHIRKGKDPNRKLLSV